MAIDTANKRMSVLNTGTSTAMLAAVPDGTVDDGDRYSLGYCYFGITLLPPVVGGQVVGGSQAHRVRRRNQVG